MGLTLAHPGAALGVARLAAHIATAVLVLMVGCTSDAPRTAGSFCSAAKSASSTCKAPSDCDGRLTTACTSLDQALSPSTVTAAKDCLESGVCGAASCLGRAQSGAKPTGAHLKLAQDFCAQCAPDVADCAGQFYARRSKLPGGLVLPYSEAVATAVDQECTGNKETCRAKFASCATETIARVVGESLDAEAAECVVASFRREVSPTGPGGSPTIATCTPANCDGCCRDDRCEKGDTEARCGTGGAACQICAGAQKCGGGLCMEPCGPNNCAGCCDGDTCVSGTETARCGGDGIACKACTREGPTFVCSNSQCIDGSCQATCATGCCSSKGCQPGTAANACGTGGEGCFDCGFGRLCNGATRSCVIDPNALWDFYVSFAVVPSQDKKGASWDESNGAPDPYLTVYSNQGDSVHGGQTSVQNDTTVPFWAETPLVGVKASELLNSLAFDVWDSDTEYDDLIGGCPLPLKASFFDGSLQSYKCPVTASDVEVELYFRIRPHK